MLYTNKVTLTMGSLDILKKPYAHSILEMKLKELVQKMRLYTPPDPVLSKRYRSL